MLTLEGIAASTGIAMGRLLVLANESGEPEKRMITDTVFETARVDEAIEAAKNQLHTLHGKTLEEAGEETAAIFDIHILMLEDDDYLDNIHSLIQDDNLCAEYAVYATGQQFAEVLAASNDVYMQERGADLRDLTKRIIRILSGRSDNPFAGVTEPVIVAAEELLPSQTVQMDKNLVLAFLSQSGSVNSHASILARNLGIPSVTSLGGGFEKLMSDDFCIVDGFEGCVILSPSIEALGEYERKSAKLKEEKERLRTLVGVPAQTKDGVVIELCANIGRPDEAEEALKQDAEGIGLMRSEFLYLDSNDFPTEEEQFLAYKQVLTVMHPRRVVVRTLDLGADKQAPYFKLSKEENPALGYRAIRICLDRMDIFMPQLRALLRASVFGRLAVMFPMITSVEEVRAIRKLIDIAKADLDADKIPYSQNIEYGIMIETPAAVMIADLLAREVDFFSIGTNDLTQYTFAADRMNSKISYLFDSSSLAILRMIRCTAEAAHNNGIWVGICGESAADTSLLQYYIGMGIDELSVSAPEILKVKAAVRELSKTDCITACDKLFGNDNPGN